MFSWVDDFQLFLFDFDGLLVNTEHLHFEAYKAMCRGRGVELNWDFDRYCMSAHFDSTGLRDAIYKEFPKLFEEEPKWDVLYAEKKRSYQELLGQGKLQLMPGVENLLQVLSDKGIKRCVVTHSLKVQIDAIRNAIPALSMIPMWFTREDYVNPKPAPDGYLKAIELLGAEGDSIIGFEDTMRGLRALQGTRAKSVLVCSSHHPQLKREKLDGACHFESFERMSEGFS